MSALKTYVPASYAAELLHGYAEKSLADWINFLVVDALHSPVNRQIPFDLYGGKRYYDLNDLFAYVATHDFEISEDHLRTYIEWETVEYEAIETGDDAINSLLIQLGDAGETSQVPA